MKNQLIRQEFPTVEKYTYLDSANLVLKPQMAIREMNNFYKEFGISARTESTKLSHYVKNILVNTKVKIAKLLDAKENEIIFSSGTTHSLKLLVKMFSQFIDKDSEIVVSKFNYSSNIAPWIELANLKQAKITITDDVYSAINSRTKLVAASIDNLTFNSKHSWKQIYEKAHKNGAILINDAAQRITCEKISLTQSDAIVFSSNKFYGPTGLGIVAVRNELIDKIDTSKLTGGAIVGVNKNLEIEYKSGLRFFEDGTPNISAIFMMHGALNFFEGVGYEMSQEIIKSLSVYAHDQLFSIKNIEIYSNANDYSVIFNIKNIPYDRLNAFLGMHDIYASAVKTNSRHLHNIIDAKGYVRISFGIYNNKKDIDRLIEVLNSSTHYRVG